MGVEDIDEDILPSKPLSQIVLGSSTQATSGDVAKDPPIKATVFSMDELFGPTEPGNSVNKMPEYTAPHSSPEAFFSYTTPPTSSGKKSGAPFSSALDQLFSNDPVPSASFPSDDLTKRTPPQMIYVNDTAADTNNLLDFSKPAQVTQHKSLESFLDAFERRVGAKHGEAPKFGNGADSLERLTRNSDDNKVKARLLSLLNHYDVLGVSKDASTEVIKKRYRYLSLQLHPDKTGDQQTEEEKDLFKAITTAYEVLLDDEQRSKYDEQLRESEM